MILSSRSIILEEEKENLRQAAIAIGLAAEYDDLVQYSNGFTKKFFCSKTINPQCNFVYFEQSDGKSSDSKVTAFLGKNTKLGKVYAKPYCIEIGKYDYNVQFIESDLWEVIFDDYQFPAEFKKTIQREVEFRLSENHG